MVLGDPQAWSDLLDSLVPEILAITLTAWESLPPIADDEHEDNITVQLCRALRQNRDARELPLQVQTQQCEIDPQDGEDQGRQDIVFNLLVPSEAIYFCLEGKRLNAKSNGVVRAYASEYVSKGMVRFITGQYSKAVRHGGMIAYVLDKNVKRAIDNVDASIKAKHLALGMRPPGTVHPSAVLAGESRAKETHHARPFDGSSIFRIHHLFVAVK